MTTPPNNPALDLERLQQLIQELALRVARNDAGARACGPVGSTQDLTEFGMICEFRDQALNLLSALTSAQARIKELEGGWRPIESAPRDGSSSLFFFPATEYRGPEMMVGWLRKKTNTDATHFRELPAPPAQEGE